jgi:hypothetical protein
METQCLVSLGGFGSDGRRGFAMYEEGVCGWAYNEAVHL